MTYSAQESPLTSESLSVAARTCLPHPQRPHCVCFCVYVHVHVHLPPLKLPSISFSLDTQTTAAQVLFTRPVPVCAAQSRRQIQTTRCVMSFSSAP